MSKKIYAQIEEAVGVPRHSFPLTHGCPFAQGALHDPGCVCLTTVGGDELSLQTTVLATWPDGSIKWLPLDTQVDVCAKQIMPVQIEYGTRVTRDEIISPLAATYTPDGLQVETGSLTIRLN